jgi:hypothetical protein
MDFWNWVFTIFWFCVAVACAVVCGSIAEGKGYSRLLFTILGFLFFIITLIVVLVLPSKDTA